MMTLPFHESRWVVVSMILQDIVALEGCLYIAFHLRDLLSVWLPISLGAPVYVGLTAGVLVLPIANSIMGLYPGYGLNDVERIRRQVMSLAIVFSSLLVWDYLAQNGIWSRGILLMTWVLATVLLPVASSWLRALLMKLDIWGEPIVVIRAGPAGEAVVRMMRKSPKLGLVPVAMLDDDPQRHGTEYLGVPVLGGLDRAPELAKHARTCAISRGSFGDGAVAQLASALPFPHVVVLPDIAGLPTALVEPRDFAGALGLELRKNLLLPRSRIVKRGLDLAIGVPLFVFALPLMLILCLVICIVSPGSPVFRQEREGADSRMFGMYKMRTMYPDAEQRLQETLSHDSSVRREWLGTFKLRDDPRTLPWIGSFLRKSSLDELPQLANILLGDMSIVGPRPFPRYHLEQYSPAFRQLRGSVKPGLTGLWQVEVRSNGDIRLQEEYDTYYIRNWSLWLDFYIVFKTVPAVLSGRGAR